jgi:hypothetical protein
MSGSRGRQADGPILGGNRGRWVNGVFCGGNRGKQKRSHFFCDTYKSSCGRCGSFDESQKFTDLDKVRGGNGGSTIGVTNFL